MSFSQSFDAAAAWAAGHQPVVVGVAVAAVVLTGLCVLVGRWRSSPARPTRPPDPLAEEKAAHWAPPEQSFADLRGSVRREGYPVRILLASAAFRNGASDGYVLDRSTGGLRIALPAAVAPGSTLQARAANAPDTVGYVTLIVRSCARSGDFFEVGCEFEKTPPWNVLLLFG